MSDPHSEFDELVALLRQHVDEIAADTCARIRGLMASWSRDFTATELDAAAAEAALALADLARAVVDGSAATEAISPPLLFTRVRLSPSETFQALLQCRASALAILQREHGKGQAALDRLTAGLDALLLRIAERIVELSAEAAQDMGAQREEQLSGMLRVVRSALGVADLDEALTYIGREIASVVGVGRGAFYLLDEQRFVPALEPTPEFPPLVDDMIAEILRERRPVVSYDAPSDPRVAQQIVRIAGFKSSLGVPLVLRQRVAGVVLVVTDEHHDFSHEEIELIQGMANTAALAIENVFLYHEAQQIAVVRERSRIARDLHDGSNQLVAAALYGIQAAQEELRSGSPQGALSELSQVKEVLAQVANQNRLIISGLRLSDVGRQGLVPALQWYADAFAARWHIPCELEVAGRPVELADDQTVAAYRVVQEALNNAAAHSHAAHVSIHVGFESTRLCVRIADDGQGFDPTRPPDSGRLGLLGMRERADSVAGQLDVQSAPGQGTLVEFCMPLANSARRAKRATGASMPRRKLEA